MRNAFVEELIDIASVDKRIVMLSADMGNRLFDGYKSRFPDRFFNCGVAEANMISMAAGFALCGMRPVCYTITPFVTARCLEQIKVDICYHDLAVIIVGVGSGLSYAELGVTHHSCDDIAFLRVLPNMSVVCPGDKYEVKAAFGKAVEYNAPVYIRLGKKNEPVVHKEQPSFSIGKGIVIRSGEDICLLSTGNMLPVVARAADELKAKGVRAQVVSFHTVKPLDKDLLLEVFFKFKMVVAVEEHSLLGGFGSSISEWCFQQKSMNTNFLCLGIGDEFFYEAGNQEYARQYFGLTPEAIADKVIRRYRKHKGELTNEDSSGNFS
jgi:transketolase